MLQLIRAILKDPEDPTQCCLLFANQVGLLFAVPGRQGCVGWAWSCGTGGQNQPGAFLTLPSKEDRAGSPVPSLAPRKEEKTLKEPHPERERSA